MADVVLVTGRHMGKADPESHLLVAALRERGVESVVRPWGDGFDWAAAALVVVRTPWDYSDQHEEFIAWARQVAGSTRLVNPVDVLEWNSHKGYLLELCRAGVPTVSTTLVPRGADRDEQLQALAEYDGELVVKPAVSAGARGALRTTSQATHAQQHLASLAQTGDALVQPLAEAVMAIGEVSLIFFGGVFSHAIRKIPAEGDYRVQAQYGGRVEAHSPSSAELDVAAAALRCAPQPTIYGRVDLVEVADRPTVMELEVIEPELFLGHAAGAAARFADQLVPLVR
jgi:glutathione synthase/RimK-type ligase-like ATP-grasp enzyme